jgi:hypothetical protein
MKIFGYNLNKINPEVSKPETINYSPDNVDGFSLSQWTDLPTIKEDRNHEYVKYGSDNMYPSFLKDMFNSSPTHQAIVKTKAQMMAGDGYTVKWDHLNEGQKVNALKIIDDIVRDLADTSLDFQLYGAYIYEIIWSLDHTKIVEVNRLDPATIRSGKFEEGSIEEYFYSRDWASHRPEIIEIPSLDPQNKQDHRQILYVPVQMVSNEYYGEPAYQASMDWITLESQTGLYYRSLIENGFNPSVVIKFFRKPGSLDERASIVNGLKRSFGGVKNTGKAVVLFSDGKELAPEITPIDVASIDKQFTVIASQITEKILTGARVTTPELFGIAIPGQLGSGDFAMKVQAFERFVVRPDQMNLERTINRILSLNGFDIKFELNRLKINPNV